MIRLYLWFYRLAFVARGTMGAVGTRPSLRPLFFEGETKASLDAICAAGSRMHILLDERTLLKAFLRPQASGLLTPPQIVIKHKLFCLGHKTTWKRRRCLQLRRSPNC